MKIIKHKANLVPYRFVNNNLEFYLSLRSKNAKQFPDTWSFWGGGIEDGENAEQTMLRELKEELDWVPNNYEFLGVFYDSMPNEKHIYFTEVDLYFESKIKILESQGGGFFSIEELKRNEKISKEDLDILLKLDLRLQNF